MEPFFSIIIVSYQAGEELEKTVGSVLAQTETDFEILIKDGGSTDGSLVRLPKDSRIRLFCEKDEGIYDAMNQAAGRVRGRYVLFLNCGDYLYDGGVLAEVRRACSQSKARKADSGSTAAGTDTNRSLAKEEGVSRSLTKEAEGKQSLTAGTGSMGTAAGEDACVKAENRISPVIFYGDTYERKTQSLVMSNPKLDAFGCYRNIPCHQSCFYPVELIMPEWLQKAGRKRTYEPCYRVRADYEHFLWCYFRAKARTVYVPLTICSYEGGGFSESRENRAAAKKEHRAITALYMEKKERFRYRVILILTLAPLRTYLARSRRFSGVYQSVKRLLYKREEKS